MNATFKSTILALTAALSVSSAHPQVVYHWNFNDGNATGLSSLSVTGTGTGNFSTSITGVTTDGTGQLAINNAAGNNNAWLSITDLGFNSVGSVYRVETKINDWNFTGNTTDAGVFIGFMSGDNSIAVASDFNITASATNMLLRSRIGGTIFTNGASFDLSGSDLWVRMDVAYNAADNKTTTLAYSTNGTNWTTAITNQVFADQNRNMIDFRFRSSADMSGANEVTLDYLTVSIIPESGTLALLGLSGLALVLGLRRRR